MSIRAATVLLALTALAAGPAMAQALPPPSINYQGVLRDAGGAPLDGTYDMEFRFHSFTTGETYILRDLHVDFYANPVTVTDGLFQVALGGGVVSDGPGPGTYTNLSQVFRDYSQVYLEVRIEGESLNPRIRVLGAAYASNADNLDGQNSSWYLNTADGPQAKTGSLTVNSAGAADYGLTASGHLAAGHFTDTEDSGEAYLGDSNRGIRAYGTEAGGYFLDSDGSGDTFVAYGHRGIDAWGQEAGGYFKDSNGSGQAFVAYGDAGISASGSEMGGSFADSDGTASAWVAYGNVGIQAEGSQAGGYFLDSNGSGETYVGYGNYGVHATASYAGGYFQNPGYSHDVLLAGQDYALEVDGTSLFEGEASFGAAGDWVKIKPALEVGVGVHAKGDYRAGLFENDEDNSTAHLADDDYGVWGEGPVAGGRFHSYGATGYANCGYGDRGIDARGNTMGGGFTDLSSSSWGYVGYSTYKIYGSGTVSFVQNHPLEPDRVIVYAAPEGDEVATYTRGTSRLVGGEAHVALGETFEWVTNPDIGLTAQVTARKDPVPLAVVELSTREMVVRAPEGSPDVVFDYIVYGLRIGFEESSIVQEKTIEAYIPSMADHRDLYAAHPELAKFSALERYAGMREEIGLDRMPDLTASNALESSIVEFVPGVHALPQGSDLVRRSSSPEDAVDEPPPEKSAPPVSDPPSEEIEEGADAGASMAMAGRSEPARSVRALTWLPAAGRLEPGDLVVLDPDRPGHLAQATVPEDRAMIGVVVDPGEAGTARRVAARESDGAAGEVPVVHAGVVSCKADAGYGAIRPGDTLTSSPTPGHAMLAADPTSGAVLGKAIEPLETGTGTIRVLVLLR